MLTWFHHLRKLFAGSLCVCPPPKYLNNLLSYLYESKSQGTILLVSRGQTGGGRYRLSARKKGHGCGVYLKRVAKMCALLLVHEFCYSAS